jgi:hypothetical protein
MFIADKTATICVNPLYRKNRNLILASGTHEKRENASFKKIFSFHVDGF